MIVKDVGGFDVEVVFWYLQCPVEGGDGLTDDEHALIASTCQQLKNGSGKKVVTSSKGAGTFSMSLFYHIWFGSEIIIWD
jgi:hypothetical protein